MSLLEWYSKLLSIRARDVKKVEKKIQTTIL